MAVRISSLLHKIDKILRHKISLYGAFWVAYIAFNCGQYGWPFAWGIVGILAVLIVVTISMAAFLWYCEMRRLKGEGMSAK